MTIARIRTGTINGIEGEQVLVEADTTPGVPAFNIVGLPDATVSEAKERVKSAIKNAGYDFPLRKVIINLAPADVRKVGSGFDLPMAVSILQSSEYFPSSQLLEEACFCGELSLDGSIRPVKGILAIALMAKAAQIPCLVVPKESLAEASLVEGIDIYGLEHLSQLPMFLDEPASFRSLLKPDDLLTAVIAQKSPSYVDFKDIKGQRQAKRALEIAAAGGHNVALFGPPGTGKSMLAKGFTGILPSMDLDEILEVSRIYSVAGLLNATQSLIHRRPFRSPHHSASTAGIIGGGNPPKPGEITLAHQGVLFLDEFTEFPRTTLEVLRQPLEDGLVTVSRAQQSLTFPAGFILLAAMNPCPCGYKGDTVKACICSPTQVQRYWGKISGPLLDRIDLQLEVSRLTESELLGKSATPDEETVESSQMVQERVIQARERQKVRFCQEGIRTNSEMLPAHIKKYCQLNSQAEALMRQAVARFNLTGRSFDRLLKLTLTIADLEGSPGIQAQHLAEALQYRGFEKLVQAQPALSEA